MLKTSPGDSVVSQISMWSILTNPSTITAAKTSTAGTEDFQAVDGGQEGSDSGDRWPHPLDVKKQPRINEDLKSATIDDDDSAADISCRTCVRYHKRRGVRSHYQMRLIPYRSNSVSIETRGKSRVRACAISIRSKGSRCDPGSRPARSPFRTVMGNS